jgi:predicted dehydrogenase
MKILIAGLGSIGRRHLRNLIALGEEEIILYHTGQSTLPEEELAGFQIYDDLDSALGSNPTAVIVATPTAKHLDIAIVGTGRVSSFDRKTSFPFAGRSARIPEYR